MARYTGPRVRISRRFGVPIFGPSKYLERRNYGPGMHGPKSRRKHTDYALGLIEKQKLRYYYGLLERQFRGVYERALKRRGVTGETMLQILETRLDNVVYHLGFANTRAASRQMVTHGHIKVITAKNGRILGATLVGAHAGELISTWTLALSQGLNIRAMTGIVVPYPTLSEIGKRAAITYFSPSLSNPRLRKLINFLRRFG